MHARKISAVVILGLALFSVYCVSKKQAMIIFWTTQPKINQF